MSLATGTPNSTYAAVWIDHKEALIAFMPQQLAGSLEPTVAASRSNHHVYFTGGQNGEHRGAEDQRGVQLKVHLNHFSRARNGAVAVVASLKCKFSNCVAGRRHQAR